MDEKLDFVVIGAAKSGTTALHQYLTKHKGILLPYGKEAPFFSEDEIFPRGWQAHFNHHYPPKKAGQIVGKVTPQYMAYPAAAPRIRQLFPETKIIAILREPISRFISQYNMCVSLGIEAAAINTVIERCLEASNLEEARIHPTRVNTYVVLGEYGRILSNYYHLFDRSNILVIRSRDLSARPEVVLREILQFIGAGNDGDFDGVKPIRALKAGQGSRFISKAYSLLDKAPIKRMVKAIIPKKVSRAIGFWLLTQRSTLGGGATRQDISKENLLRLDLHYRSDLDTLKRLTGIDLGTGT